MREGINRGVPALLLATVFGKGVEYGDRSGADDGAMV